MEDMWGAFVELLRGRLGRFSGNVKRRVGESFWNCDEVVLRDLVEL